MNNLWPLFLTAWAWLVDVLDGPLGGLLGGVFTVLLWEGALKPRRERVSLARVLEADLSLNMQQIAAQKAHMDDAPGSMPTDFTVSTLLFDAIASRLGELPRDILGDLAIVYRLIAAVNRVPPLFAATLERYREVPEEKSARRADLEGELDAMLVVLRNDLERLITRINALQPRLIKLAYPLWSMRRWRARTLEERDIRATVRGMHADRAERLAGLREGRDQP